MNIISFCVYGTKPLYIKGMVENLKLVETFYPGWTPRVYISSNISKEIAKEYKSYGAQVYQVNAVENGVFAMYRYLPLADPDVDRAIFRDADSRLNNRESEAVKIWIQEDTNIHIMRDHPYHGGPKILGGMWGAKGSVLRNIQKYILKYSHLNWERDIDQLMLHNEIYPLFKDSATVHDEIFDKKPFPVKRNGLEFVGCQFDENNNLLHPEYSNLISTI